MQTRARVSSRPRSMVEGRIRATRHRQVPRTAPEDGRTWRIRCTGSPGALTPSPTMKPSSNGGTHARLAAAALTGEQALRELLVRSARSMVTAGLVTGTSGNLSVREPGSTWIFVTPSGVDYDTLRPEDLVPVDLAGQPIDQGLAPSVDTPGHLALYR